MLWDQRISLIKLYKISWICYMYSECRSVCNTCGMEFINCDLEDISNISVDNFFFAMRRFITEVRRLDGSAFPTKPLYKIVACMQFHKETFGLYIEMS